ncbi:hypothetical protein NLJ89_g9585 [Agrocybe chaxingu]|uniref:Uncharacterized protein n=1 Tax=Agrocybe chaxingu TaxID=84603 RepID=A0A9W8JS56_9AGAR|nr:hypothetical protein NLJ89_g9585 [Agrocybe chaxingu]
MYVLVARVILQPLDEADTAIVASRHLSFDQVANVPVHSGLRILRLVVELPEHQTQALDRFSQLWSDHRKHQDKWAMLLRVPLVKFCYMHECVSASTVGVRPEDFLEAAKAPMQPNTEKPHGVNSSNPLLMFAGA